MQLKFYQGTLKMQLEYYSINLRFSQKRRRYIKTYGRPPNDSLNKHKIFFYDFEAERLRKRNSVEMIKGQLFS